MVLKRLLGLGSKRLRALTVLFAAAKAIRNGRLLRGGALTIVALFAWKYMLVALVAELLVGLVRSDDEGDAPAEGET